MNNVLRGKLLESETLAQQAGSNTRSSSPTRRTCRPELINAIIGALDAHTAMSTQALNSEAVQRGLMEILLDHAGLYEGLRQRAA